jgi:hypothetical protein
LVTFVRFLIALHRDADAVDLIELGSGNAAALKWEFPWL